MIKGILFDYGGVVADGGRGIDIASRLSTELGLPDTAVHDVIMPLFSKSTRGKITDDELWESLATQTGMTISDKQRHIWDSWWSVEPYPKMLEVIDTLKAHGYMVGLLTNIFPSAAASIEAGGGYNSFDFTVISCRVGFAKPDPEMYELALAEFKGLKPEEIVFIDDQEKCMPPAKAVGLQTILATSTDQVLEEMRKLDLPV